MMALAFLRKSDRSPNWNITRTTAKTMPRSAAAMRTRSWRMFFKAMRNMESILRPTLPSSRTRTRTRTRYGGHGHSGRGTQHGEHGDSSRRVTEERREESRAEETRRTEGIDRPHLSLLRV